MLTLVVRKVIRASPERLFAAWTEPAQLRRWWGPAGVECTDAEVDLRVGGGYRIANRFADGRVVWIAGEFEVIEPPRRLVYSWRLEGQPGAAESERVTVRFDSHEAGTEVVVSHERIATTEDRDQHTAGWEGCLEGLALWVSVPGADERIAAS
jgi:uncharacterized protein YndB with AHSA1/START domain